MRMRLRSSTLGGHYGFPQVRRDLAATSPRCTGTQAISRRPTPPGPTNYGPDGGLAPATVTPTAGRIHATHTSPDRLDLRARAHGPCVHQVPAGVSWKGVRGPFRQSQPAKVGFDVLSLRLMNSMKGRSSTRFRRASPPHRRVAPTTAALRPRTTSRPFTTRTSPTGARRAACTRFATPSPPSLRSPPASSRSAARWIRVRL
jgi:hypothetical protein